MAGEKKTTKYDCIRLGNQLCFPLYACAKEVVRLYRKPLEKQGLINRVRPDSNERKLFLSLTEAGESLKDKAVNVPEAMQGCIGLPEEELLQLKRLLDKALIQMETNV